MSGWFLSLYVDKLIVGEYIYMFFRIWNMVQFFGISFFNIYELLSFFFFITAIYLNKTFITIAILIFFSHITLKSIYWHSHSILKWNWKINTFSNDDTFT